MVVYKSLVINSQNTLTHTFGQTKSAPAVMSAEILKSDTQKNKTTKQKALLCGITLELKCSAGGF